jgi:cytoskeleton protein RodZ
MSLGQELKKRREARGIPLEEIAASTKIGTRYLEAIENDNLDLLPGAFLTRGIIRAYARSVGLDENELLKKYREAGMIKESGRFATQKNGTLPAIPGKNKLIIGAVIIAGLILIIIALLFLWKPRRSQIPLTPKTEAKAPQIAQYLPLLREKTETGAETGTAARAEPVEASKPEIKPDPYRPAVKETEFVATKRIVLDISFQEETWIQVFADGVRTVYELKPAGDRIIVEADYEILMNVGNAGGFTYLLNGKPGKTLGRAGRVVNDIRITPDNLKSFLAEENDDDR